MSSPNGLLVIGAPKQGITDEEYYESLFSDSVKDDEYAMGESDWGEWGSSEVICLNCKMQLTVDDYEHGKCYNCYACTECGDIEGVCLCYTPTSRTLELSPSQGETVTNQPNN